MQATATDLELSDGDRQRAECYRLLAALLAQPPRQTLIDGLRGLAQHARGDGSDAWRLLGMAAAQTDEQQAADEYQQLFIGIGRGELVPYGSWYQTGFLMERPLLLLRHRLRELGFERRDGVSEPEDHAAALCEVMAFLIEGGSDPRTQREFFESHIGGWIGRFFDDLQQAAAARFYRGVGAVGATFTAMELELLATSE